MIPKNLVVAIALTVAACGEVTEVVSDGGARDDDGAAPAFDAPGTDAEVFDFHVDATNGNDSSPGTEAQPFKTLTHAAGVAQSGQSIKLLPGIYDAPNNGEVFPILILEGVRLIGDEASQGSDASGETLIIGANPDPGVFIDSPLTLEANTLVAGLRIINNGPGIDAMPIVLTSDGVVLRNNTLANSLGTGVYVSGGSNQVIRNNLIVGNNNGIAFVGLGGNGVIVEGNEVRGNNAIGIELDVEGADMGGGPNGSQGGNTIVCNVRVDLWTNVPSAVIPAANNRWDHSPPVQGADSGGSDLHSQNATTTFTTSGASLATAPCP